MSRPGRTRMYGNQHGLPGLPQAQYMPLGGHPPRRAPPPGPAPMRMAPPAPPNRIPPPAPPMITNLPPPQPQPSMPQPDPLAARRIDMLEQRLNQTEQSNRTLLDELMRLQQELKMNVKKNEMGIVEEKEAINRLDTAVRQSQNKTYEADDRLRRCEDGIKDVRNAVQLMSSHSKSIEKTIASFQQEQVERRSNSANRLQEYRHEVMKMNQSKEQLERLCYSLRDEMREIAAKVDNLNQEMGTMESNMKLQARLMEDVNTRRNLTPKTAPKMENNAQMTETVRLALEGKMIQMNTTIQDLTQRLNLESKKREKVETDVNIRLNELLEDYGSSKLEKDKEMREFDDKMKELQVGFSASEKQRIHMEISSVAQDLSRKIDEKEVKLRDDTVNKLAVIEKTLLEENKRRTAQEKALQDKVEAQMKESKMYGDEGADALKKHVDQNMNQVRDRLGELQKNVSNLDGQVRNHKLETEKILAAEIKERKNDTKMLDAKHEDLEDRVRLGLATLQAAIGDQGKQPANTNGKTPDTPDYDEDDEPVKKSNTSGKPASNTSGTDTSGRRIDTAEFRQIERMQNENFEGIREQVAKDMAKLENRLGDVETKVKQQDERLENRLKSANEEDKGANSIMGDKIQQKIDSVAFSQERLKKQVDALQEKVQDTPKGVTEVKEQLATVENNMTKKIDQERKERMDDVAELKADIDKIIGKNEQNNAANVPSLARLNQDIDETQTGLKKLGSAVHVVKERLDTKLKEEKKERVEQDNNLTHEVEKLITKYTDLNERVKKATAKSTSTA